MLPRKTEAMGNSPAMEFLYHWSQFYYFGTGAPNQKNPFSPATPFPFPHSDFFHLYPFFQITKYLPILDLLPPFHSPTAKVILTETPSFCYNKNYSGEKGES
jgi:hypothetical protein